MNIATTLAQNLLDIGALKLSIADPYTWASGWRSPIYCDNRKVLSFVKVRKLVQEGLAELIRNRFPTAEVVAGVATAGIPHAALVANELSLPMIYVRDKPKGHGMGNQIEGVLKEGQKVVVIEDLVSTGMSSLKAVEALRIAGAEVIGMVALFTYGFPAAAEAFAEAKVELRTLSNYAALVALLKETLSVDEQQQLAAWREEPSTWGI